MVLGPPALARPAVLAAQVVGLVVDLREVLGDFDLDLVRDHDAVDVAAQVGPEDGERGHDGCDVDFEHGQDDGLGSVEGRVELGVCGCFVLD